jgi:hypothetical protein
VLAKGFLEWNRFLARIQRAIIATYLIANMHHMIHWAVFSNPGMSLNKVQVRRAGEMD